MFRLTVRYPRRWRWTRSQPFSGHLSLIPGIPGWLEFGYSSLNGVPVQWRPEWPSRAELGRPCHAVHSGTDTRQRVRRTLSSSSRTPNDSTAAGRADPEASGSQFPGPTGRDGSTMTCGFVLGGDTIRDLLDCDIKASRFAARQHEQP